MEVNPDLVHVSIPVWTNNHFLQKGNQLGTKWLVHLLEAYADGAIWRPQFLSPASYLQLTVHKFSGGNFLLRGKDACVAPLGHQGDA